MEILGIGTDIVECPRIGKMIEQHGELFSAAGLHGPGGSLLPVEEARDRALRGPVGGQRGDSQGHGHRLEPGHLLDRHRGADRRVSGQPQVMVGGIAKEVARQTAGSPTS